MGVRARIARSPTYWPGHLQGYHGERASSFALLLERQQAAAAAEQAEAAAREAAARLRAA